MNEVKEWESVFLANYTKPRVHAAMRLVAVEN